MTNGQLLERVALDTGLMRYVDVHNTEAREFEEAAARYEALKAERDADALALAVRALEEIQQRSEPLGIDRGDSVTHLIATNALAALKGGGK